MASILDLLRERDSRMQGDSEWNNSLYFTRELLIQIPILDHLKITSPPIVAMGRIEHLRQSISQIQEEISTSNKFLQQQQQAIERLKKQKKTEKETVRKLKREASKSEKKANRKKKKLDQYTHRLKKKAKRLGNLTEELSSTSIQRDFFTSELTAQEKIKTHLSEMTIDIEAMKRVLSETQDQEIPLSSTETETEEIHSIIAPFGYGIDMRKMQCAASDERHNGLVTFIRFGSLKSILATASDDQTVAISRYDQGRTIARLQPSNSGVMCVDFSANDEFLITASYDSTIKLYKTDSWTERKLFRDNVKCVRYVEFCSVDNFVSCSDDPAIKLYNVNRRSPVSSFQCDSTPLTISTAFGSSLSISSHHNGSLCGWDLRCENRRPLWVIPVHQSVVNRVTGIPNKPQVASLSMDHTVCVTDIQMQSIVQRIRIMPCRLHSQRVTMAVASGKAFVGSSDGKIYEFDLTSGKQSACIAGHDSPIISIAARRASGLLVTGDKQGVVRYWQ